MEKTIRIGTRGSKLALWQAHFTQDQLKAIGVESELVIIKTRGDQIQHLGFDKMEGKGFFTKEIEDALLRGDIDVAVHSMKDLPTQSPEGLVITAVSYRENPADWLVVRKEEAVADATLKLKENAVVGTSSARRKAQLLHFRPDIQLKDIRGNVPTRLNKLREGQFDGIVLAAAGLSRLEMDLSAFEVIKFSPKEFIPAPAQGVLAWQTNEKDIATRRIFKQLHQQNTSVATNIERKVLRLLDGGCQMPLGVYCEQDRAGNFHVWAALASAWDQPLKTTRLSSSTHFQLAEQIFEQIKS
ncbi:MAG: hydroxymethylbilane synthase [Saprospiraceae bacterium]|nr:hydroxymethylbilane synthase [Saprospiraceae bacterium]